MRTKRIAFIRPKPIPIANLMVPKILGQYFPDHKMDVMDIEALIKSRPDIVAINIISTLLLYGREIVLGHKRFRHAFWRTSYIYRTVKRLVKGLLAGKDYDFTFQMQSIFDCSVPGIPHFIYTDHTHLANLNYPDFDRRQLYGQRWIELEKKTYQNADITFVRSTNIRRSLLEQYGHPQEKVLCVYAGSNIEMEASYAGENKYNQQNILFVGLDWERKGGPDLVAAFKLVRKKYPKATLTIVGASPHINEPNCIVVGKVPPQKLKPYYDSATVFCMPTYVEPFGIVFVEAMQARLPIIATNVGAVPDFLQDGRNGWMVEPGDVQGIADAIMKIFNNPDLCKKFGERNFALAQERYSWGAVGNKFHIHISAILSNPAQRRLARKPSWQQTS